MDESYGFAQCLQTYKSASGIGMHVRAKHSPTLKSGECTQPFAHNSQLKVHKKKPTQQMQWM